MACPFFEKLAPELRATIYEYVFFSDEPIKRVQSVETPREHCICGPNTECDAPTAAEERRRDLDARITAINNNQHPPRPQLQSPPPPPCTCRADVDPLININLLCVSKTVHQEAIKSFYDVNTISIDFDFIARSGKAFQAPLAGSDPALTKHLLVKFNTDGYWGMSRYRHALTPETIDIELFFKHVHALFPLLQHIDIHTDGMPCPVIGLLRIGHNCLTSWDVRKAATDGVGSLAVETHLGFSMAVKFKRLAERWEACSDAEESSNKITQWTHCLTVTEVVGLAICTRKKLEREPERGKLRDLVNILDVFRREVAASVYEECGMEDHEFWSFVVGAVAKQQRLHC